MKADIAALAAAIDLLADVSQAQDDLIARLEDRHG